MSGSCGKCGAGLDGPWKFCPHCGAQETVHPPAEAVAVHHPHGHDRAPAKYAFGGLFFGIVTAPVLIIYGTMMCLLGPPMVFGIPVIIAGVLSPFVIPYLAINAVRGKCPWCGEKIASIGPLDAFFCQACSKRIVVKHRELLRAE